MRQQQPQQDKVGRRVTIAVVRRATPGCKGEILRVDPRHAEQICWRVTVGRILIDGRAERVEDLVDFRSPTNKSADCNSALALPVQA